MQPDKGSPFTFIVRLWREKSDSQTVWRGSVDHVQSGERAYFQAAAAFMEIISDFMKETFPEKVEPGGPAQPEEHPGL